MKIEYWKGFIVGLTTGGISVLLGIMGLTMIILK